MTSRNLNALKHGAYSEAVLLYNESRAEFDKLHSALIDEWDPQGPTEHDKILSVAINMWRKRRIRRQQQKDFKFLGWTTSAILKFHDLETIERPLQYFRDYKAGRLKDTTEENLSTKVGEFWASQLKQAVPRSKFSSDEEWRIGILDYLILASDWDLPVFGGMENVEAILSHSDCAVQDLAAEEKIDAKIARDLKELGQIKTMKSMGLGKPQKVVSAGVEELPVVIEAPAVVVGEN